MSSWQCQILLFLLLLGNAAGQVKNSLEGRTFRNDEIGFTYTFPAGFTAWPEDKVPQDATGREHVLLALWNSARSTPVPRMVFLYDALMRPSRLSMEEIAQDFLRSLKPPEGAKLSKPSRVSLANIPMWRMDYWRPDDSGQSYDSAIVIPLQDRRVLFIQMNAASQSELDVLVESLRKLKFGRKKPVITGRRTVGISDYIVQCFFLAYTPS